MNISMSKWDRWAPATYLFIIGIAIGFVTGLGVGLISDGSSGIYIALLPVVVILILFVVFVVASRRIEKRVKN